MLTYEELITKRLELLDNEIQTIETFLTKMDDSYGSLLLSAQKHFMYEREQLYKMLEIIKQRNA